MTSSRPSFARRFNTWTFRHWQLFAIFFVVCLVAYVAADQLLLRKLANQRESIRASGGAVSFADLLPGDLHPSENVSIPYQNAADMMGAVFQGQADQDLREAFRTVQACSCRASESNDHVPPPEEQMAVVAYHIAALAPALDMVDKAQALPGCRFVDFSLLAPPATGAGVQLPTLAPLREIARNLAYKSAWEASQGNINEAMYWITATLRLANDLTDTPTMMSGLVRIAIATIALESLQDLLCDRDQPIAISQAFYDELAALRDRRNLVRFLEGERCYAAASFANMGNRQSWFGRALLLTPSEISQNKNLQVIIAATLEEDFETRQELLAPLRARAERDSKPKRLPILISPTTLADVVLPAYLGNQSACNRLMAMADLCRMALALRQYKLDHGAYPPDIDALVPAYIKTPLLDPFTGKPYHYRPERNGFIAYSVADDGVDDGGTVLTRSSVGKSQRPSNVAELQQRVSGVRKSQRLTGDIAWCAAR